MQTVTKTYSGAQIIIQTLNKLGIDKIFGYPGGIVLKVYDELSKQNNIKHYLLRHEQAACHAAEGYARISGKCGLVLVTSGPGATNIVTGLANAYLDGYPLIAITGQVTKNELNKNAFQEVNIIDITRSCTKKNYQVTDVSNLQSTIIEAYNTAMSGKQGPVLIDITKNVFDEISELQDFCNEQQKEIIIKNNIIGVLEKLNIAKKAVIIAGSGAAVEETEILAKKLNIPVVSTMMGKYPTDDNNYIGMIGIFGDFSANEIIKESDLIFAIGTRLNNRIRCCFDDLSKNLIHLDINENEFVKSLPKIGLVGDSKTVLNEINSKLKSNSNTEWLDYAKKLKLKNPKPTKRSNKLHSFEVMQEIKKYIKDYPITTEVGQHQVWSARYLRNDKFITSGGLGTMGFGLPAAIGACIANNNKPVICIAGDGSIQMNIQELATISEYNLPIKMFILNNGYLGMVRQLQEKFCNERYYSTKISNPDFISLSRSFGIDGLRVDKIQNIQYAMKKAFEDNKPFVIEFVVEAEELL